VQAIARQPQRAPDGASVHYERHRPEQTTLYRLVQQHAASFIAHTEASTGAELPRFIKDEFDAFLECGILAHGFLRLRCGDCGHDKLVAFSCKRRGFCPSCGARRMSQTAAHLVDHVIPHVPVRQWVLSLPIALRLLLAAQPQDGVYRCGGDGVPSFVEVDAPTDDELHALLQTLITRLMKLLTRRGALVEDMGETYLAEPDADGDEARTLRPLQAAAVTYRIAFGPRARHEVLTLGDAMPRDAAPRQPLCADIDGFSLHAAVRCEAHDRKRLEQLCRYITRPALSDERVQCNAAGQVEFKLKTPWRDGTTHLVVPQGPAQPQEATEAATATECEAEHVQGRPHHISWARLLQRVFDIDMQHCAHCGGGELKIVAAILERPVIEKILKHLGPVSAPSRPRTGQ